LTYGPIGTNTQKYYGVSSAVVDLMLNYGPITFIPFAPLTAWLTMQKNGLRYVVVSTSILCCVAMVLRWLPVAIPGLSGWAVVGMHIGQVNPPFFANTPFSIILVYYTIFIYF
jgi:hypothetical protein